MRKDEIRRLWTGASFFVTSETLDARSLGKAGVLRAEAPAAVRVWPIGTLGTAWAAPSVGVLWTKDVVESGYGPLNVRRFAFSLIGSALSADVDVYGDKDGDAVWVSAPPVGQEQDKSFSVIPVVGRKFPWLNMFVKAYPVVGADWGPAYTYICSNGFVYGVYAGAYGWYEVSVWKNGALHHAFDYVRWQERDDVFRSQDLSLKGDSLGLMFRRQANMRSGETIRMLCESPVYDDV